MMRHCKSLYVKFFLVILLFLVLPLILLFSYGYRHMETAMIQKVKNITETNLEQMNQAIQRVVERVGQTADYLSTDVRLNRLLRDYDDQIPSDADIRYFSGRPGYVKEYAYLQLAVEVQSILSNYAGNWLDRDCQMGLILGDGQIFTSWPSLNTDFDQLDAVLEEGNDANTFFSSPHNSFILYNGQSQYITFVRRIYDIESTRSPLAHLIITIPMSMIKTIVRTYQPADGFSFYLFRGEQDPFLSVNDNIADALPFSTVRASMAHTDGRPLESVNTGFADDSGIFTGASTFPILGWTMCYAAPYEAIFAEITLLRETVAAVCFFCFLLIALICFIMVYQLLKPLRRLKTGMNRVQQGDWGMPALPVTSGDEVGMLTDGFNCLTAELHHTAQQIKEVERQKSEFKFEMLLAQINPHFLFNTLNSIKWMATMVHADKIISTIQALARLLEISMNKQADILPISEELKNLRSYLDIQSIRYSDLFTVEYDVDSVLALYEIPKLVFQPIVENSIIHNIQEQSHLLIQICGRLNDGVVEFTISDNGKGMTPQQVEKVLSEDSANEKSIFRGIGVRNVMQRLRLKYGVHQGFAILSSPGNGTSVHITFPATISDSTSIQSSSERFFRDEVI